MNNHIPTEHLIDYLHGELNPADDALVLAHIDRCDACKAEYNAQVHLSESLAAYARLTERDLPAGVRAGVWQAVNGASLPSGAGRLRAWLRPALGLGLAAAAAIAIAIGVMPALHQNGPAAIDAMYFLDDHAAMRASVPFNESGAGRQWLSSNTTSDVAVDAAAQ